MEEIVHEGEPGARPLVSYRVQCYRHEAFVREAVTSVLAQTYRPLEIVITDDASPDRTFEIVQTVARAYRGPHRVVLYRSEQNRDIFEHFNEAAHLMRGAFLMWLAGDDVAAPEQTECLVNAWLEGDVSGVWSNCRVIDEQGRDIEPGLPETHPYTLDLCDYADGRFLDFSYSGTCGYTREILDRFGPVPAHLGARGLEHHLGFRASILGHKRYLPQELTRKRRHPNQSTAGMSRRDRENDPVAVHERQIRVRLQVLIGCRDTIADLHGKPHAACHAGVARDLSLQIANESRRLLEFEAFRAKRRGEPDDPDWRYPPNSITFVRTLREYQSNLVAGECKYFSVPWRLGVVEPCDLRNHALDGVQSAWTEAELLAKLKAGPWLDATGLGAIDQNASPRRLASPGDPK
jgi:glycosyltransferase involved in cell wall biosynthesis